MSKELSLPLTGDGTGYLKEAVEQQVALEQDQARKIVDRAQQLLLDAEQRSNEIIADAEHQASTITSGLDELRDRAMEDLEKEKSEILLKTQDDSRKKLAASEKKASHIIEEAMSKVHALVKTAQSKLENAKRDSKALELDSARRYADATSKVGELIVAAEEYTQKEIEAANYDAENIRLEAETMLAYSQEESRIIRSAAQVEANKVADEAVAYQQEVSEWAESELESAREKFEQFKTYYDDRVSRLNAMHHTSLEEIRILSGHEFPDGSHLKVSDDFSQHLEPPKGESEVKNDEKATTPKSEAKVQTVPVSEEVETFLELDSTGPTQVGATADEDLEEFVISESQSEKLEEIMGSLSTFDDDEDTDEDMILIEDDKK